MDAPLKGRCRGVRKLERSGRPNPYGVQWREKLFNDVQGMLETKVKTLFFPTAESRDGKFAELSSLRKSGMMVASLSRRDMDGWRAFRAATNGVDWQTVVAGWKANLTATGHTDCQMTVEAAVEEYLQVAKNLRDTEKMSADHYRQKKHKLNLFDMEFGHLMLDRVKPHDIEAWISDFDEVRADLTFDNYLKHVRAFYGYWIKVKQLIKENPCERVQRRHEGMGDVEFLTVPQTAKLFYTALTYRDDKGEATYLPAIGRLALEAFIGLRFASGCRIAKEDINYADRGITLPKKKLKTKKRHYIDGLPDHLWDWLGVTPDSCWELTPRQYLSLKSNLFTVADVPHPHNCFRHGFATYDVAAHRNAGRTAYILCHRNQDELFEHYLGRATREQGRLYQTITPTTAQQISEGVCP